MVDGLTIRHSEPRDAAALHQIYTQPAVVRDTLRLPHTPLRFFEKRINRSDHVLHLVACADEQVLGDISLLLATNLRRRHAAALGMAVSSDHHRQGIGTRLLQAALELANDWLNLSRIELEVFCDNRPAVQLYQKFAFEIEGTLRQYAMREGRLADVYMMARLAKGAADR